MRLLLHSPCQRLIFRGDSRAGDRALPSFTTTRSFAAAWIILGTVTDPVTNQSSDVLATYPGRVLGMALNQVVLPGYAAFHIGIESTMEDAKAEEALTPPMPLNNSGPIEGELSDLRSLDAIDRELEISE